MWRWRCPRKKAGRHLGGNSSVKGDIVTAGVVSKFVKSQGVHVNWGSWQIEEEKIYIIKLDGVGPVDNKPSTDKLHHFAEFEEKKSDM